MSSPQMSPAPVDLDVLDAYLRDDRAPPDCMDLSQLDGFLAGIIVGPDSVPPSAFLPLVWGGEEPEFADNAEAESVLGTILGRYNEIASSLEDDPSTYSPVFWQEVGGGHNTEDWAVGFMQAVGMDAEAWKVALQDEEASQLMIPIGVIAGLAEPEMRLRDVNLPDGFLDELLENAPDILTACVVGLREFWLEQDDAPSTQPRVSRTRH